ncbi:UDP-glucuronosyltransferase 1-2 [Orchesella cincta]|uniref:UDP-glucuronosyltransferase n=1 Tax=Orchesella cincta TaxID=48709 RepID=A0A1D2MMR9_ORCCI|nr:UDP-glucuronosyltransferase 1-2 [Orchesella cincta]
MRKYIVENMAFSLSSCSAVTAVTVVTLLLIAQTVPPTEGANILFFIGFGGPSHRIGMMPLINGLADEGHNVTFLGKEKPDDKDSKITYFLPKKMVEHFTRMGATGTGLNMYGLRAGDPEYLDFLKSNKFDLVVVDALFNECAYGIAHVNKAKIVLFSVSTVLPWAGETLGMPDESSTIPDVMMHFPVPMSFFNRVYNAIRPVFWKILRETFYLPKLTTITKEALGLEEFPEFEDLERNISLAFVNTHVAQEFPRSLAPNVVPIGGMSWVEKRKPLPKDIEDFINRGKEGFFYVSFGSFIDFLTFPDEVQQKFITALKRFPNIQFIWKLNKTPDNLPKNFYVDKWLPQQEILLHPKIRAFITHSGIGGVNEAIFSSVPMICFPLFAEQDYNADLVELKGFGIKMEITNLIVEDLENAILKLLGDKTYSKNAKKVSQQFQDRPLTPLQTGLWWTNFVLRQESTDYIRPASVYQSWWVKRQLDVWLFILLLLISINSLTIYVVFKLFKRCTSGSSTPKLSSVNKSKAGKKKQN